MKAFLRRACALVVVCGTGLFLASCGKSAAGSTYEGIDGAIKIEFQSGGKAITSIGPLNTDCTYTEDIKSVTLTCEGQPAVLTINDDGSLTGPPGGMMGRLTKKQ